MSTFSICGYFVFGLHEFIPTSYISNYSQMKTYIFWTFVGIISGAPGRRFVSLLADEDQPVRNTNQADPYGWELQLNPISQNSCYSLDEDESSASPVLTVRDTTCIAFDDLHAKCHGGFPFYRFTTGSPECTDCMDARQCQRTCLSKGMDAAALVLDPSTRNPTECRCGATRDNTSVWGLLRSSSGEINFGPVHGLLPPSANSALSTTSPSCRMFIYIYNDVRESDGGIPRQFLDLSVDDERYIRSIVSGLTDPGDVEDSTVADMERVHLAVRDRLQSWMVKNPSGRVPSDEVFVEQVAESVQRHARGSSTDCSAIDEPSFCWDNAVTSVLTKNGMSQVTPDQSAYTPEYSTMMMTLSMDKWRSLFNTTSKPGGLSYTGSGFCSSNGNLCPITCGECEMYDRPAQTATMYNSWVAYKDASSGKVNIPVVFDLTNQFITSDVQEMVRNATAIVNAASCLNFHIVEKDSVSSGENYVLITAYTDSTGKPSGCLADPVGLPDTPPTNINVGGCSENRNPLGSLVHEFLHVLGLVHTQMRPDRDEYIQMNPAMVKSPFEVNFFLAPYAFDGADGKYSPYDYGSIMHYTRTQAANATKYQATSPDWSGTFKLLESIPAGVTIGQRNALSALDIAEVNTLYKCIASVVETTTTTTMPTAPTIVAPPSSTPWSGWEPFAATIATALTDILGNHNITLSEIQTNSLTHIQATGVTLRAVFDEAVRANQLRAGWSDMFSEIASDVRQVIAESRDGISSFDQGINLIQSGILDDRAIADLETIIDAAKHIYEKLDAFEATLIARDPTVTPTTLLVKSPIALHHPAPRRTVVVFGNSKI
jgi:hypothetical protein